MMSNAIRYFGPQWFESTMGTGALIISMALVSEKLNSMPILRISQVWLFITMILFAVYIVPWTIRFFKMPGELQEAIKVFIDFYNHRHYHEGLGS
jgi:tellurite resistance protein TehA-like permease